MLIKFDSFNPIYFFILWSDLPPRSFLSNPSLSTWDLILSLTPRLTLFNNNPVSIKIQSKSNLHFPPTKSKKFLIAWRISLKKENFSDRFNNRISPATTTSSNHANTFLIPHFSLFKKLEAKNTIKTYFCIKILLKFI